ncbi:acyl-CoA N-acyltransferase [Chlamydoabsidia padenii]|nr:acyl-CoA N-acyltransferase [Chlamydoabsidia padenii]
MITIERLKPDDIEQLVPLVQQQLSSAASFELIQSSLDSPTSIIWVAKSTTQVVGTATLAITHCLTGLRCHIEDVVVDTAWRRQGIAQQLFETALTYAQHTLQARTIDLTSRPERVAANTLYRKLGFVERDTHVYRYQPLTK